MSQFGRLVQRGKCTSLAEARRMGVREDGRFRVGDRAPRPLSPPPSFRKNMTPPSQWGGFFFRDQALQLP